MAFALIIDSFTATAAVVVVANDLLLNKNAFFVNSH